MGYSQSTGLGGDSWAEGVALEGVASRESLLHLLDGDPDNSSLEMSQERVMEKHFRGVLVKQLVVIPRLTAADRLPFHVFQELVS